MSNIAFELDQEQEPIARIKVIGVGGAGGNAIRRMIDAGLSRVEFIAINTDEQVLHRSGATTQICIGDNGLGAGGRPEVGRQAIEKDRDKVADSLSGSDMVFITAGMGGGTGTGAAPVVAELSRDVGALTVGVVTTPFVFEGNKRMKRAMEGLAELRKSVDTLMVISNERLLEVLPGKTPISEAFREADNVLRQAVQGITDIILVPGLINLDFADVRTVMSHHGNATMGTGVGIGEDRATKAAKAAISSPLLEDVSIEGAKGLLVNITAGPSLTQDDIREAMATINQAAGPEADVFFGVVADESMPDEELRVTLIATGFDVTEEKYDTQPERTTVRAPVERPQIERPAPAPPQQVQAQPERKPQQQQPAPAFAQPLRRPNRQADSTDLSIPAFQRRQQPEPEQQQLLPQPQQSAEEEQQPPQREEIRSDRFSADDVRVPTFIRKARRRF